MPDPRFMSPALSSRPSFNLVEPDLPTDIETRHNREILPHVNCSFSPFLARALLTSPSTVVTLTVFSVPVLLSRYVYTGQLSFYEFSETFGTAVYFDGAKQALYTPRTFRDLQDSGVSARLSPNLGIYLP